MTDIPADAVRIVATLPTDPAGAAEASAALAALVEASRQEEGCYQYEIYESGSTPGLFISVEAWRSQADLDAHAKAPHFLEAFGVLGPLLQGQVGLHPLTAV